MIDFVKKGMFAGIGAVVLTKDKIQEITRRLVEEGKLSTEEAEKTAEDFVTAGERQWDDINHYMREVFKNMSESMGHSDKKELQELRERVEILEQKLAAMENADKSE